ncbi:MAG: hypothetical protein WCS73_09545 [Lentisphaeria bacterium]
MSQVKNTDIHFVTDNYGLIWLPIGSLQESVAAHNLTEEKVGTEVFNVRIVAVVGGSSASQSFMRTFPFNHFFTKKKLFCELISSELSIRLRNDNFVGEWN